jgi:hypothetical protein
LNLTPQLAPNTNLPVTLDAGAVYSVLVLERNGKLSALVREDAKGAQVVPNGAVDTGLGGLGEPATPPAALQLALAAAAALACGGLVVAVRRRRAA